MITFIMMIILMILPYICHFEFKYPDWGANSHKVKKHGGAEPVKLQTLPVDDESSLMDDDDDNE